MSAPRSWNTFFFVPRDVLPMAVFRITIGLTLLYNLQFYWQYFPEWLSNTGMVTEAQMLVINPWGKWFNLMAYTQSEVARYGILAVFGLAFLLFLLGVGGRAVSAFAYASQIGLLHANPYVLFGFDEYLVFFLVPFLVDPGQDALSLKAWRRGNVLGHGLSSVSCNVAVRLLQLGFGIRYFGAGYFKTTPGWKDGDILWQVLTNYEFAIWDLAWLHPYWSLLGFASTGVLLFELFFIPLYYFPPTRMATILFGIGMHLGIAVLTSLTAFGFLLIQAYVVLIDPALLRRMFFGKSSAATSPHV
jgi:hypothetical protein